VSRNQADDDRPQGAVGQFNHLKESIQLSLTPKLLSAAVLLALGATAQANPVADQARGLIRQNPAAVRAAAEDTEKNSSAGS
jgi:hypothetical protein